VTVLLHILDHATWESVRGGRVYRPASLDVEGFIHLSTERQWLATANRFFRGRADLILLVIDPARLSSEVRYEPADGDHFPHLYGPLELEAVVAAHVLPLTDDQTIGIPAALAPGR
jgi:uncharacterized protein (DUF952 family)